jgi:DNA repair photolyase
MLLEDLEKERVFVSFGGKCPYRCRHCYTFCDNYQYDPISTVNDLVKSLKEKEFSLVYISGHKENFVNPDDGLELCEEIFSSYYTDILLTTRNVFDNKQLKRLCNLNERMKLLNKDLFVCVSIPALQSYKKIESSSLVPSPDKRIDFIKRLYENDIYTILTIRPLFPDAFISVNEPLEILHKCKNYVSAVISSGIVVDDTILENLKTFPKDIRYIEGKLMQCLGQNINVRYVNVEQEYKKINEFCQLNNIYLSDHSIPVIQYLKMIKGK